jgi:hypothetical protein
MRRGLTKAVRFDQVACDSLVQRPPVRRREAPIDRFLDVRVSDLVQEFGLLDSLGDETRLDEELQPRIRFTRGLCAEPSQLVDVDGPPDDSEQVKCFPARRVKALNAGGDPVRQCLRNPRQAGRRKVSALVDQAAGG